MARQKPKPRRSFVRLEALEDRMAPALFTQLAAQTSSQLANNGFVATGDWNKDGIRDIVMTNYGNASLLGVTPGKTITFAQGDGTGKFTGFFSQAVGGGNDLVSFLAVGDLNNDGNPDIVTANTDNTTKNGTLTVFLGSAGGAFTKTAASPVSSDGSRASWVGIADFNKDGKMDVAVVNLGEEGSGGATGRSVSVFKGDGTGAITSFNKIDIPLANGVALAGAIADFNGDTFPDLAVSFANVPPDDQSPQIDGSVRVFMNKQDGTLDDFASSSEYASGGPFPVSIAAGDFSGDGKPDIAIANVGDLDNNGGYVNFGTGHALGTLTNGGSGTFGGVTTYTAGFSAAFAVALADLNLDGKIDIAVCDIGKPASLLANPVAGGLAVYLGKTSGVGFTFDSSYVSPADEPQYIAIDSFNTNTDATPDLVMVHSSNKIVTFLNTTNPGVATTTTLTVTPSSPATFGGTITVTATVGATAGTPTGTVTFYNGINAIGTGTISTVGGAQVATLPAASSNFAVGNYTFSAKYEGVSGFAVSKSSDTPFVVDKASTTTTLTATPSSATLGGTIKLTATVASAGGTPTGSVAFFDNGVQIGAGTLADVLGQQQASVSISNFTVGSHPITVEFQGATSFAKSTSGTKSVTINPAAPASTTTTLAGTPNPSLFGQSVTFTASVVASAGTPSGSVTFTENGVVIGGGPVGLADNGGVMKASVSISNLSPGTHPIVASYGGVVGFSASSSFPFSQLVNTTATATTVATGPGTGPYAFESNVTFTATVTATAGTPSGFVQFSVDGAAFGSQVALLNVGGSMQATLGTTGLPVGTHQVTAQFLGSAGQDPSGSGAASVTISSVGTTTTVVPAPATVTQDQAVTLTATIARNATVTPQPGGTVTFRNGTTVLGTAPITTVGGAQVATITTTTLPRGTATITASYPGDATFGSSTSGGATVTVNGSAVGLVGYREFGVGVGAGLNDTAQFYNPDGSLRFAMNLFPGFTGGVRVTSADFNGDGVADLVAGTGPGAASQVVIVDGVTKATLFSSNPFEASFKGGVYVAAGDINGDGTADLVITPDEGGGPRCRVFSGVGFTQIADFFGIDDPNFRGGARASVADMNGDLKGDLIVSAGFLGGPRVAVYNGAQLTSTGGPKFFGDFFVFEESLRNGAYVAGGDVNGDGFADLIAGGGPGGGPRVYALSGKDLINSGGTVKTAVANFFAGDEANRGGIRVVARDLDGDSRADIVTGSGDKGGTRVSGYLGKNTLANGTPPTTFSFDALPGFNGGVFVG